MSAEDIQFNLDNPPVGSVDFDFSSDLDFSNFSTPYSSGFSDWLFNLSDVDQQQLLEAFAQSDPESYKALGSPLTGADLAVALGEGRPVGEISGEGGFTASTTDQAAAMDTAGKNAVGAGLNLGSKSPTGLAALKKRIADALGVKEDTLGDMAKYATALGIAKLARDDAEKARKEARGASFKPSAPVTATRTAYKGTKYSAAGGLASLAEGGKTSLPPRYLDGHTDGMADNVPAHIDRKRPAALSDGEFVIPADVVSHLGNGNSNAGAKRLYEMMDRIRSARTGNPKQGKQINPNRFLPR